MGPSKARCLLSLEQTRGWASRLPRLSLLERCPFLALFSLFFSSSFSFSKTHTPNRLRLWWLVGIKSAQMKQFHAFNVVSKHFYFVKQTTKQQQQQQQQQNQKRFLFIIWCCLDAPEKSLKLRFLPLDLTSLESVHAFSLLFDSTQLPLHGLVNNAGIYHLPNFTINPEGFELTWMVNYLAPWYLTTLLEKHLKAQPGSSWSFTLTNIHTYIHTRAIHDHTHALYFPPF